MAKTIGNLECQSESEARTYAWSHFAYHAQQRQTVFNFFLILVAGCIAAYATTLGESQLEYNRFRIYMGALLALASLLFWRLDKRNARLVKISENALKALENRLAAQIHDQNIRLIHFSEVKLSRFPLSSIESFGQIYRFIFICSGAAGLAMAIFAFR